MQQRVVVNPIINPKSLAAGGVCAHPVKGIEGKRAMKKAKAKANIKANAKANIGFSVESRLQLR